MCMSSYCSATGDEFNFKDAFNRCNGAYGDYDHYLMSIGLLRKLRVLHNSIYF
jgi:hypothetical protein